MSYEGDFTVGTTVLARFSTNDGSGGRVAFSDAIEVADLRIYKNGSATRRTSEAGWTLSETFDSMVGIHWLVIDLSDDTDAGFYAPGNDYAVVLYPSDETVDSQAVSRVVAEFSIENRFHGAQTSGTGAISVRASSFTLSFGAQTLTYTATHGEDSEYHEVEDAAGVTDGYYEFNVGGNGVPVSVAWVGYAQGQNSTYFAFAWNYGNSVYEPIGHVTGTAIATEQRMFFEYEREHVGTGADIGKVRFRILSADGANFATDRLLLSYSVVFQSVGYDGGQVWLDTNNGTDGDTPFVHGVADNPCKTWANVLSLFSSVGLSRVWAINGSSYALTGNSDNYTLRGSHWTLDLNDQSMSGTNVEGATVTGDDDGSNADATDYHHCIMTTNTLGLHSLCKCGLSDKITIAEAGTYDWVDCHSRVAGTSAPSVDTGVAVANVNLNMRDTSGGIEVENLGQAGTDNMSLEGHGQIIINANCVGGTIARRGHWDETDNSGGAVIWAKNPSFSKTDVSDQVWADMKFGQRSDAPEC